VPPPEIANKSPDLQHTAERGERDRSLRTDAKAGHFERQRIGLLAGSQPRYPHWIEDCAKRLRHRFNTALIASRLAYFL
jgi:hypothetical protein